MVLTDTGLAKLLQRIKSFVIAQLNSKASAVHTHSYSDITDLPSGIYTPPTFTYDSSTETLTVSNTTATVFNYDSTTETLEIQING